MRKEAWVGLSRGVPGSDLCFNQNHSVSLLLSFSNGSLASLQLCLNNYLGYCSLSLGWRRDLKNKGSAAITQPGF